MRNENEKSFLVCTVMNRTSGQTLNNIDALISLSRPYSRDIYHAFSQYHDTIVIEMRCIPPIEGCLNY